MMAEYVDGFVVPVKKDRVDEYRDDRREGRRAVARVRGDSTYKECIADDVDPGKSTSFPQQRQARGRRGRRRSPGSATSRGRSATRSTPKVMADPPDERDRWTSSDLPMDLRRMFFGGFEVIVDA